jgi:hypothetical protein
MLEFEKLNQEKGLKEMELQKQIVILQLKCEATQITAQTNAQLIHSNLEQKRAQLEAEVQKLKKEEIVKDAEKERLKLEQQYVVQQKEKEIINLSSRLKKASEERSTKLRLKDEARERERQKIVQKLRDQELENCSLKAQLETVNASLEEQKIISLRANKEAGEIVQRYSEAEMTLASQKSQAEVKMNQAIYQAQNYFETEKINIQKQQYGINQQALALQGAVIQTTNHFHQESLNLQAARQYLHDQMAGFRQGAFEMLVQIARAQQYIEQMKSQGLNPTQSIAAQHQLLLEYNQTRAKYNTQQDPNVPLLLTLPEAEPTIRLMNTIGMDQIKNTEDLMDQKFEFPANVEIPEVDHHVSLTEKYYQSFGINSMRDETYSEGELYQIVSSLSGFFMGSGAENVTVGQVLSKIMRPNFKVLRRRENIDVFFAVLAVYEPDTSLNSILSKLDPRGISEVELAVPSIPIEIVRS